MRQSARLMIMAALVTTGCASSSAMRVTEYPGAAMRVTEHPSWPRDARVRFVSKDAAVPGAVRRATEHALRDAGLAVVRREPRQPGENLLLLRARCVRHWPQWWQWQCAEYAARIVDGATGQIYATATLVPLQRPWASLATVADSVRQGFARSASEP
jgi:hypothetical protein